ncbi:MAG: hypothetical protein ACE5DX_01735 [Candidatus Dojkabacteria bacterium]
MSLFLVYGINAVGKYNHILLLSHLVFALYLDKDKVDYLTDVEVPQWLLNMSAGIIQLFSAPDEILERRTKDSNQSQRDRIQKIEQIKHHQFLCDRKWEQLSASYKKNMPMTTIENKDEKLENTIESVLKFIKNISSE